MSPEMQGLLALAAFLACGWLAVVCAGESGGSSNDDDDWWDYR